MCNTQKGRGQFGWEWWIPTLRMKGGTWSGIRLTIYSYLWFNADLVLAAFLHPILATKALGSIRLWRVFGSLLDFCIVFPHILSQRLHTERNRKESRYRVCKREWQLNRGKESKQRGKARGRDRKRQKERDRGRDRTTDRERQRHRETETETERQRGGWRDTETEREREPHTKLWVSTVHMSITNQTSQHQ